ncbi:hypothetical protein DTL70_18395 [Streptomyces diacarni]|uniref:Uncharacterized protein n=1 Tax=Streptomyces diacarni TaxID=2800381 RepID=A0A367EUX8_9ACTN|nr:hypothetical protein DTL70_18395 [Streptomyces diacarni]
MGTLRCDQGRAARRRGAVDGSSGVSAGWRVNLSAAGRLARVPTRTRALVTVSPVNHAVPCVRCCCTRELVSSSAVG